MWCTSKFIWMKSAGTLQHVAKCGVSRTLACAKGMEKYTNIFSTHSSIWSNVRYNKGITSHPVPTVPRWRKLRSVTRSDWRSRLGSCRLCNRCTECFRQHSSSSWCSTGPGYDKGGGRGVSVAGQNNNTVQEDGHRKGDCSVNLTGHNDTQPQIPFHTLHTQLSSFPSVSRYLVTEILQHVLPVTISWRPLRSKNHIPQIGKSVTQNTHAVQTLRSSSIRDRHSPKLFSLQVLLLIYTWDTLLAEGPGGKAMEQDSQQPVSGPPPGTNAGDEWARPVRRYRTARVPAYSGLTRT